MIVRLALGRNWGLSTSTPAKGDPPACLVSKIAADAAKGKSSVVQCIIKECGFCAQYEILSVATSN